MEKHNSKWLEGGFSLPLSATHAKPKGDLLMRFILMNLLLPDLPQELVILVHVKTGKPKGIISCSQVLTCPPSVPSGGDSTHVPVFFTQTQWVVVPPFMIGLQISLGLKRSTTTHCVFEKNHTYSNKVNKLDFNQLTNNIALVLCRLLLRRGFTLGEHQTRKPRNAFQ